MDKKGKKSGGGKVKNAKNASDSEGEMSGDDIVVKPNKMSAFSLLAVEEPEDSASDKSDDEVAPEPVKKQPAKKPVKKNKKADDENEDANEIITEQVKPTGGGKKQAKNKKGKNIADEEDIDAVLAELSLDNKQPSKKEELKKKKKGKKAADNDEDEDIKQEKANSEETKNVMRVEITSNMTQEEIAKAMEEMYGADSDDEKKKKKQKKAVKKVAEKQDENKEGEEEEGGESGEEDEEGGGGTVKTAAQKKREKKERQKQERLQKTKGKSDTEKPAKATEKQAADAEKSETASQEKASETGSQSAIKNDSAASETATAAAGEQTAEAGDDKDDESAAADGKKKSKKAQEREKKKKASEKEKEDKATEKKPSKMVRQMQEQLRLMKEQEEKLKREEEEKIKREEEALRLKLEKERLEKERKEREKRKKKEKIERQKAEGTYLTAKERENRRRAQQMLEAMKAQGLEVPQAGETVPDKPKKVVYDSRKKKKQQQGDESSVADRQESAEPEGEEPMEEEQEGQEVAEKPEDTTTADVIQKEDNDDVKDAWDVSSDEEEGEENKESVVENKSYAKKVESAVRRTNLPVIRQSIKEKDGAIVTKADAKKSAAVEEAEEEESKDDDESEEDDDDESEEDDDDDDYDDESEEEDKSNKEKAREKALARIQKRKEEAEAKKSPDNLRAPVVCVLGHVDTGKTKILDKLRRTNVQDGEAGGITQQIGATNVPQDTIREQTKMCKDFIKKELKIPGLLIIDTPGHESFSNLRTRGSSLCDIAILVIDIMHGLEPQTIESINLLKSKKTPFVVALNKIDRLFQWQTNPQSDVLNTIKKQKQNTKLEFEERARAAIVQLAEQGLNAALFYDNKNVREYVNVVPTSAQTGDGMGNLIATICDLTQTMLSKQLMFSEELKATVMEVKALPGLGTTIDVILVNGELHEGETIIVAGQEGPIVTQIRALLMPQPLRELRVKSAYEHHKVVKAAQGCKIVAKDLERALAGLPLLVAKQPDEIDIHKEEVAELVKEVLGSIKVQEKGVFVQASTLGSLEALLVFLKSEQIPFAGINIGPVHKRDIMKASVMLERDEQYATILAFDVKVEREAQEMADQVGVRIFTADIIYHLFDKFTAYRKEYKKRKQEEFKHVAVFPCKLRILPNCIFKTRDPIVIGVTVEAGFLKEGTVICVPSKEFVDLGRVASIEVNHKPVERAVKGQEVCIKIDPIPGEAPKMFGRHFEASDLLVSKISRASIDAVKDYFREELSKADWVLMVELKKMFEIL